MSDRNTSLDDGALAKADPDAQRIINAWLHRINENNHRFRTDVGSTSYAALGAACCLLSVPRSLRYLLAGERRQRPELQCPWLPYWPALTAKPLHDAKAYPWTEVLRQASDDIRRELSEVVSIFERARYDSPHNEKRWNAYYFFLHGRPIKNHLAACPNTREALAAVPHNGLHVCFSALEPGGALHPHTGPTNASLTAHLGLTNCAGAALSVAGMKVPYRDNEVLIFDDSFVHWAGNDAADTRRYTLMITFWHPELNFLERRLLLQAVRLGAV